jgi:hypothetical protein
VRGELGSEMTEARGKIYDHLGPFSTEEIERGGGFADMAYFAVVASTGAI